MGHAPQDALGASQATSSCWPEGAGAGLLKIACTARELPAFPAHIQAPVDSEVKRSLARTFSGHASFWRSCRGPGRVVGNLPEPCRLSSPELLPLGYGGGRAFHRELWGPTLRHQTLIFEGVLVL